MSIGYKKNEQGKFQSCERFDKMHCKAEPCFLTRRRQSLRRTKDLANRRSSNKNLIEKTKKQAKSEQSGSILFRAGEVASESSTNLISTGAKKNVKDNEL